MTGPGDGGPGAGAADPAPGDAPADPEAFDRAARAVARGADPRHEAHQLVAAMTPDERRWCLDGDLPFWAGLADLGRGGYHKRTFPAAAVARLGVPGFHFSDGPRGVVIGPATAFPVSMARGATWDVDLEERIGEAIGCELRAVGADLYGGVCVNLLRHPAWGRAQETYGEDPHHVGELGAALTRGVQRHAMACVKHFACNSMENARFTVDVTVDDDALHDVYLPHFRRMVDEGVAAVMSAYNSVNGEWCGENRALLTDVLRGEWGFNGFVISDWIFGLRDATPSLEAGLDVEMPYRMIRAHELRVGAEDGAVSPDQVDEAVARVVATRLRFHEILDRPRPAHDVLACPEHRALAREAATKAVVLLRNEPGADERPGGRHRESRRRAREPSSEVEPARRPLLPLDATALRRVALVGRLAGARNLGDGGSSDVWAPEVVTPRDGLAAALGGVEIVYHDGADGGEAAAALARRCDLAVVVVGYTRADEGEFIGGDGTSHLTALMPGPDDPELAARFEAAIAADPGPDPPDEMVAGEAELGFATGGDRVSLRLHGSDEELIATVAEANPCTVVAVVAGSAVVMSPWIERVPAVVQAWYSGMEGGHALAAVLLGAVDATGRLPFSVPTDAAHLPPFDRDAAAVTYDGWHGWWRLERDGHPPAFPFGFGLSFTTWELRPGAVGRADDGAVTVDATVHNTGARDGTDVVQVYSRHADRPDRRARLVGFARVDVAAGEEVAVTIRVPLDRFGVRDPASRRRTVEPGSYELELARYATDPEAHRVDVTLP